MRATWLLGLFDRSEGSGTTDTPLLSAPQRLSPTGSCRSASSMDTSPRRGDDAASRQSLLATEGNGSDWGLQQVVSSPWNQTTGTGWDTGRKSAVDWQFLCRLTRLFRLLRPRAALLLVALSVAEALVVARVGKVAGSFYRIIVDRELEKLAKFLCSAGLLYSVVTVIKATNVWLSELLALRWRAKLTRCIQEEYCDRRAFYWLNEAVDNPDQRVTADIDKFCTTLGEIMQVFCAMPLQVLYYSWLTFTYTGVAGLGIAYGFFLVGTLLQRIIVSPLAQLVFRQEQLEGDFRAAHLRLHRHKDEVALYRAGQVEEAALADKLAALLANAGMIVSRHWLLETCTKGLEYVGALLNYTTVAIVVFQSAAGGGSASHDSGADAELVSNASFATLTLIYAFTKMLDTAEKISNVAGYSSRICEMMDEVGRAHRERGVIEKDTPRGSMDLGSSPRSPTLSRIVVPPGAISDNGCCSFELSVHEPSNTMQVQLEAVFPETPVQVPDSSSCLLVIPTFQVARNGIDLGGDCTDPSAVAVVAMEMDRMLETFLQWASSVVSSLEAQGFWANAVDPRTGLALYGTQGAVYSEAQGAAALLGYSTCNTGVCDVIAHPVHGTRIYPATLVAYAPPDVVQRALERAWTACHSNQNAQPDSQGANDATSSPEAASPSLTQGMFLHRDGPGGREAPVAVLRSLSVDSLGGGEPIVAGLSLTVGHGSSLLITGPSGCGKSTLMKAFAGMVDIKAGEATLPPKQHVMFLPQMPLLAPGRSLAEQLLYPYSSLSQSASLDFSPGHLEWLLQAVGLGYLWTRALGDWQAPLDWLEGLSPGELQRLAIARVLARRPTLALLDEATSAVGTDVQASLYSILQAAGISIISIGHRHDLRELHSMVLRLHGDGSGRWQMNNSARPEEALGGSGQ